MALTYYQKEYIKCAKDPKYYLNTYGYVFYAKKQKILPMECFKYQEDAIDDFHRFQNNIILKSRQVGVSVITAGYVAWRLIFRNEEKILIVANDGDGAVRFLKTVKQFIEYTPKWLLPGENGETVIDNQKYVSLQNGSYAQARASSKNAGRGDSLTLFVMDEAAFADYAEDIWTAAAMALSATNGKCIMLSTPNGTSGLYYKMWTEAKTNGFNTRKIHWTENKFCTEDLEIRTNENGEKYYWSSWYEEQCKKYSYDKVKIAQELDMSFEGSKRLAIEAELVSKYDKRFLLDEYKEIVKNKKYYDYKLSLDNIVDYETEFYIFKPYNSSHKYLFGCDVARGDGKDFSTIQVIDIDTLEVVAEYRGRVQPDIFAVLIYNAATYYGKAYVVVEANSFGLATAFDLNRKMEYSNMFFSKNVKEIYVRPYDYKVENDETIPGFQTTKKTRPLVINSLRSHLRDGSLQIYSKRTIDEFRTFVQNGDRAEAEKGKNDDLIMALSIGLFIRDTEYKNIAENDGVYEGLLDAIGYSSTSLDGYNSGYANVKENESASEDKKERKPKKEYGGGIFINNVPDTEDENDLDDDDISWLYG